MAYAAVVSLFWVVREAFIAMRRGGRYKQMAQRLKPLVVGSLAKVVGSVAGRWRARAAHGQLLAVMGLRTSYPKPIILDPINPKP